jgi:DNA-binding transcriptional MocR family regulator
MITTGAGQAIAVVGRALLDPGDTVLVETPAWPGALNAFRRCGARLVAVPVDAAGLDTGALAQTLDTLAAEGTQPKLLYTVPNFQNPTGVTPTLARRQALLDLARRYDFVILEDDAYRDLAFEGALPPSLFALDPDGRVLRTGTYSKILAAGLRLGWLLGPREVLPRLIALKDDGGTSPFTSYLAATYSLAGELEPHIARLVASYRRKRDVMLAALDRYFPRSVTWTVPAGGFFVWVTLPPGPDAADLLRAAREEGVDFLPGRSCFPDPQAGTSHLRLAFSLPTPDQIEEGIKRLGGVLDSALG